MEKFVSTRLLWWSGGEKLAAAVETVVKGKRRQEEKSRQAASCFSTLKKEKNPSTNAYFPYGSSNLQRNEEKCSEKTVSQCGPTPRTGLGGCACHYAGSDFSLVSGRKRESLAVSRKKAYAELQRETISCGKCPFPCKTAEKMTLPHRSRTQRRAQ